MLKGNVSKETLYHFSCCKCKKWWSIGDMPKVQMELFCPWCGTKQTFKEIE